MKLLGTLALAALIGGPITAMAQAVKQTPPKPSGADGDVYSKGIARDPSEVRAQQGDAAKAAPGTVGAAPGADTPSQKPK